MVSDSPSFNFSHMFFMSQLRGTKPLNQETVKILDAFSMLKG